MHKCGPWSGSYSEGSLAGQVPRAEVGDLSGTFSDQLLRTLTPQPPAVLRGEEGKVVLPFYFEALD